MRAGQLVEPGKPIEVRDVPIPEVGPGDVLVKIGGAGVCHTDVHIRSGEFPLPPGFELPTTLGHENAGWVERLGAGVEGLQAGDAVMLWGGRGCGRCRICRTADEQVCGMEHWAAGGGYADYLLVPEARFLVPLGGLDPAEVAPLADAGLTPYRAVKKVLPRLVPGSAVAVLGVGGLGHMAVQILRALCPAVRVLAVDVADDKLALATALGAAHAIDGRGDAAAEIARVTDGEGADAVLDFVGTDATLATAAAAAARQGMIVLVGIAGGTLPFSFMGVRAEVTVTNSYWGSYNELREVVHLAASGAIRAKVERFPLEQIDAVLTMLEHGEIGGRAVVVP